jgi:hypothetical protein
MQLMGKFSVTFGWCAVRKEKSTTNMLNTNKVNGESSYFSHATFYVIFCDSGRFLDSRNPVKYSRICNINHDRAAPLSRAALAPQKLSCHINGIDAESARNAFSTGLCYIASKSNDTFRASKNGRGGEGSRVNEALSRRAGRGAAGGKIAMT